MQTVTSVSAAAELRRQIYNILENTTQQSFSLEQSWTRVGVMLAQFKAQECWRELDYTTFDDFMSELKTRFKRGRTQLYGYLSCAEVLLPIIGAEKLEQMGVSKALELKRAVKKLEGKPLPPALLDAALDATKTTKELRGTIGQALNLTEEPKGTWLDLDGFFMTPEERAEFKEAFLVTEALLGISRETPDHIRRKSVIMAWWQEFYGTHAVEYYGSSEAVPVRMRKADDACSQDEIRSCEGRVSSLSARTQPYTASEAVLIVRESSTAMQDVQASGACKSKHAAFGMEETTSEGSQQEPSTLQR